MPRRPCLAPRRNPRHPFPHTHLALAGRHGAPDSSIVLRAGRLDDVIETPPGESNFLGLGFQRGDTYMKRLVPVVWQACHYGAHRPYFLCPFCARKRVHLYLVGCRFICRICNALCYAVQHERLLDRLLRKSLKTRRKLGAEPALGGAAPRSKYMCRIRYLRELCKLHGIERTAELLAGCP